MLANLLPGIRDIRTPLATGYLWLLTFWLWIPSHLKNVPPTSGIPGDITRLAHYGGRVGVGVAISFIAYLVGILSKSLNPPLVRLGTFNVYIPTLMKNSMNSLRRTSRSLLSSGNRGLLGILGIFGFRLENSIRRSGEVLRKWVTLSKFRHRHYYYVNTGPGTYSELKLRDFWQRTLRFASSSEIKNELEISSETKDELKNAQRSFAERSVIVTAQLSRLGLYSLEDFSRQAADRGEISKDARSKYYTYLLQEVPRLGNALAGKEAELYSVYDRLISEYEFRVSIGVPLIALIVTLADRWSLLWLLTLLPLLVLLSTGSKQRMAAGDLLADTVRLRRIDVALPPELALTSMHPSADQNNHADGS